MPTATHMAAILVADDDIFVIRAIRTSLKQVGHSLTEARSGTEALQRAVQMERIDLLIVNHQIGPDLGREIAEHILLTHPEMKIMHVSGWPREHLESTASLTPGATFLSKPFTITQLQNAVVALLAPEATLPATG